MLHTPQMLYGSMLSRPRCGKRIQAAARRTKPATPRTSSASCGCWGDVLGRQNCRDVLSGCLSLQPSPSWPYPSMDSNNLHGEGPVLSMADTTEPFVYKPGISHASFHHINHHQHNIQSRLPLPISTIQSLLPSRDSRGSKCNVLPQWVSRTSSTSTATTMQPT
jgi:hypothetical protein